MTNVRKHARASSVSVVLDFQSPGTVTLHISDDGVGAANNGVATTGFGLLGLRERVHLLAGRLTI